MGFKKTGIFMLLAFLWAACLAPASVFAGTEDLVDIPDAKFRAVVNEALGEAEGTDREPDAAVTQGEMESLTSLRLESKDGVSNLTGIQYAVNLKSLYLAGDIQDLQPIAGLEKLTSLTIDQNDFLKDLSALGEKPNLTSLHIDSCPQFTTLDGISYENCPNLQKLDGFRCAALKDLSALAGQEFPHLQKVDLEGRNEITDITPLKGYPLTELNLEKVEITSENREGYQETIESLTKLERLDMPYCQVTDADTVMFAPLQELKTLVLNANELTHVDFCAQLPVGLEQLGLNGNEIRDMSGVARLENLEILGLGDNQVTDFSFVPQLRKLTAEGIRHAEGEEGFPFRESVSYGREEPLEMEDGRLVIENPYIGPDGKPISFEGAKAISSGDTAVKVRYNAADNTIALENLDDSVTIQQAYNLPVADGEYKIGELRITVYAKEKETYTIQYDWGKEAPEGQALPSDAQTYRTLEDAKAALDTAFTSQTTVKGEKDGKEGVWSFSGWTVTVEGNVVTAKGQWSFTAAEEPTQPTEEPTEPAEEPTQPVEEPTEPAEKPTQPAEEPTEPTEKPTEPAEEPTEPTEEPTKPAETAPAEEEQPDAPKTGDAGRQVFWAALGAAAAGGLGAVSWAKRKQNG